MQPPPDPIPGITSTPDLLAVGASSRALAEVAYRAGRKVAAIDLFCDTDLELVTVARVPSVDFPQDVPTLANRWPKVEIVCGGGMENSPETLRQLEKTHRVLGTSAVVVEQLRDPFALANVVTMPEMQYEPPQDVGWLRKPFGSAAGIGIARWHEAATVSARHELSKGPAYFQREIEGISGSTVALADGEGGYRILAEFEAARPSGSTFLYQGSLGPFVGRRLSSDASEELQRLVNEFPLRGIFGVDWVENSEGKRFVLEVNPRWPATAELIAMAWSCPLFEWHVAACGGTLPSAPEVERYQKQQLQVFSKRILYAENDFEFSLDRCDALTSEEWFVTSSRFRWCDIPVEGAPIASGEPVCTLITAHSHVEQARRWDGHLANVRLGDPNAQSNFSQGKS